jgi:single-stranded-DNA-specific exonuclease
MIRPAAATILHGMTGARWRLADCDSGALARLARETDEDPVLVRCLLNRGIAGADAVRRFLAPEFSADLHAPALLRDMDRAVARLRAAIAARERILIVTDFDVDGTTSSVILSSTLRLLGGADLITPYIPDRFTEGYGLSTSIIERAAAEGFRIIVTADIGIKSHREARRAHELGLDLIICDHHLPDGEDVPADAFAVLCPKGSSGVDYPNKHLAACGVSLKLAEALLADHPRRGPVLASLAKLTAIGSIADMVDLSAPENRAIVAHGLRALNERSSNAGLRQLIEISKVGSPLTTYDVSFKIGPRINAAGRIQHANAVLKLFDARNDDEARELARALDDLNSERQQIQQRLLTTLIEEVDRSRDSLDRVLVLAGREEDGFHRGVLGIACSKLVELFGRPTLVCAINEDGHAHGSARSVDGFHIVEALDAVSDLLAKYGGHPMAAGFSLDAARIPDFRYRLNCHASERLRDEDLGRAFTADAELTFGEANDRLARSLARLEPHGIGNPPPQFLLRHLPLREVKKLKDRHLKLMIGERTGPALEALWWQAGPHYDRFAGVRAVSLIGRLELKAWNGRPRLQLKVIDAAIEERPASGG